MAGVTEEPSRRGDAVSPVLASYAQIFFRGSPLVGALLLLATWLDPIVGAFGLGAALVAVATARVVRLSPELVADGLFGYNAVLVGVGTGALFGLSAGSVGLMAVGALATVPLTAAAHSLLWGLFGLPPLTLPFLGAFYVVLGSAPAFGLNAATLLPEADLLTSVLPPLVSDYLGALGAIFFLPRPAVGAVVLVALLAYSRVAVLLTILGFGLAQLVTTQLTMAAIPPIVLGYNLMLTAIALGGVWFVPSWSSLAFAGVGAALCALFTVGTAPYLSRAGLPLLILPFNVTVLAMLYAMRQRLTDDRPKSVDFLIGSPEENALFHWTRQARFGSHYAVQFRLPCRGRWICTQGTDGPITHRGAWRHAVDLEVEVEQGRNFRADGEQLQDYPAFGLPVTAAAAGTVIKTVDTLPDNPIGEPNLHDNWGNLVVVQHGPHLYSLTCHLQQGSVRVRPGQIVEVGDPLGACGNSGRAAVPHIHFQLQASPRVGDPTLALELHEIVMREDEAERLEATVVPAEGDVLRNLARDDEVAARFEFTWGVPMTFEVEQGRRSKTETVRYDVDLLGRRYLASEEAGCKLYFESRPSIFTVYDVVGRTPSVLHLIRDAIPRVPFDSDERLEWEDHLPRRGRAHPIQRLLGEFFLPFRSPKSNGSMRYEMTRDGERLIILGRAASGSDLTTRAVLGKDGLVEIAVDSSGVRAVARRKSHEAPPLTEEKTWQAHSQPSG